MGAEEKQVLVHFLIKFGEDRKKIKKIYLVAFVFSLLFPSNTNIDAVSHDSIQTNFFSLFSQL